MDNLPYTTKGPSSEDCLDAGLVCSIDPLIGACTECGLYEYPLDSSFDKDERYYWDNAYGLGGDMDNYSYGAESTARIIDTEAGVIAYVHVGTAPDMVAMLNANPLPMPTMEDLQTEANPVE